MPQYSGELWPGSQQLFAAGAGQVSRLPIYIDNGPLKGFLTCSQKLHNFFFYLDDLKCFGTNKNDLNTVEYKGPCLDKIFFGLFLKMFLITESFSDGRIVPVSVARVLTLMLILTQKR